MAADKIRRKVRVLDTSNQTSLFAEAEPAEGAMAAVSEPTSIALPQFEAPDPRAIFINRVRLDEHLKAAGLKAPLRIRPLLEKLSFAEFEKSYRPGGRRPYAPRAMVGLILYGILQGISSLRDLERCARSDVGCWWLSGGIMPDHSVIGRFVRQHESLLTAGFFEQVTRQVLKVTGSGTATVAGDGTVIEAMSSRFRLVKEEDYRSLIHGERPNVHSFESIADEGRCICDHIEGLITDGILSQDICLVARTAHLVDEFETLLGRAGMETRKLSRQTPDKRSLPGVRLATMHRIKGLEFKAVFMAGIKDGIVPLRSKTMETSDPVEERLRDVNERALFHVAATRAVRHLFVSCHGKPSSYLNMRCE